MAMDSTINSFAQISTLQEVQQAMPQWFQQGGIVMWLLLLASFLTTIVTLERLFTWASYSLKRERLLLLDCFVALNQKHTEEAQFLSQQLDSPVLNMLEQGIHALPFPPNDKMESCAEQQIHRMSRGQSLLDTVITMAPMLGILGTVLGIIDSFNILSLQGVDNPSAVVGGIAQALISTAMGLCVALSALLPYNLFRAFIHKLTLRLESIASDFNHVCQQGSLIKNHTIERESVKNSQPENSPSDTVDEHKEMPYHYEFTEGTDEVTVNIHDDIKDIRKVTQASVMEMYGSGTDQQERDQDSTQGKEPKITIENIL